MSEHSSPHLRLIKINDNLFQENIELKAKLEIAERMAEFLKNKAFDFKRVDFKSDADDLVEAWYAGVKSG